MVRTITMSEEEYERFCAFRGVEKTVSSVRAQGLQEARAHNELAEAVLAAFDMRVDGSEIILCDKEKAVRALMLASAALV